MRIRPSKPPILTGNPADNSILTPQKYLNFIKQIKGWKKINFPRCCLISFFRQHYRTLDKIYGKANIEKFQYAGDYYFSFFKHKNRRIAFIFPMMGSIAAAILDEAIALGARQIIFIGGVGVLQSEITRGDIIIPTRAIRDEGVSYHYMKPSQYAYPDKKIMTTIALTLDRAETPYRRGTVWTTAAPFRETITKVRKYQHQGVVAVEMEAASFFAVARHRKAQIGAIFSAGDYVGASEWDLRLDKKDVGKIKIDREELFQLAIGVIENL